MKVRPLYMVMDEDDDGYHLTWDPDVYPLVREPKPEEITLESLAQLMDEQAENCNAHDFVQVHRGLAVILYRQVGREAATRIFRQLIDFEGLHGMVGVCGKGDVEAAEESLGVSLTDWSDWQITEEKK